ncbi:RNA polymerase sigma factor [Streptomyces sp. NPDC020792]|uniref:RNA polymerase sigma factor n=1 Tax=Streptomyces sp. NPDC020792 TaxID=3365089 RepID=UPI0037A74B49
MSDTNVIAEAVDGFLADPRAMRIQRDAALVAGLAPGGFEGLKYEVFEDCLLRDSMPILRGMLRSGTFITLATRKFEKAGIPFFVSSENRQLLHSSDAERDDIIVDVLMRARKAFRTQALVNGGWDPEFGGSKGPCCLMTYFIGRCMWDFRRVYLRWARERKHIARVEAALLDPQAFFHLLAALPHRAEPEAILFPMTFVDLLDAQPPETRAVVRLTCEGYTDGEIADRLKSTPGAVRTRRYRFKQVLYQAASERKIWIPAQLHVNGIREQQRKAV